MTEFRTYLAAVRIWAAACWRYARGHITDSELRTELNRARMLTGREPI